METESDLPIDRFSIRTQNVFKRQKISKLRDLVSLTEDQLLNFQGFGKKSAGEIKRFLEELGISFGDKIEDDETEVSASYQIVDHDLPLQKFSVRTRNALKGQNIVTIGDLAKFRIEGLKDLLKIPNFGRKSFDEVVDHIQQLGVDFNDGWETKIVPKDFIQTDHDQNLIFFKPKLSDPLRGNFEKYWNDVTKFLEERQRGILEMRMGLFQESPRTLEEIGQDLGVSRERIRQIESKALAKIELNTDVAPIKKLLESTFLNKTAPLSAKRFRVTHEFFSNFSEHEKAYLTLCETVFSCKVNKVFFGAVEEKFFLSLKSDEELEEILRKALGITKGAIGEDKAELLEKLSAIKEEAGEFYDLLLQEILSVCLFAQKNEKSVLTLVSKSKRNSRAFKIAKIIQAANGPVTNREILERSDLTEGQIRSGTNVLIAKSKDYGIYPASHGSWFHISSLGDLENEIEQIRKACQVLDSQGSQEFHSRQVGQKLPELHGRLNEFELAALIRHYHNYTYLGRNVFACSGSEIEVRTRIHDVIVEVVSLHNRPMHHSEIMQAVNEIRSVDLGMQIYPNPPLVNIGDNYWILDDDEFSN